MSSFILQVESLNPQHRAKGNSLLVGVLKELSHRAHNNRVPHNIPSRPLKIESDNPNLPEISSLITVNGGKPTGPLRIGISGTFTVLLTWTRTFPVASIIRASHIWFLGIPNHLHDAN